MNREPYYEEQYKGLTIKVYQDEDADDPRNWGSLFGTMTFFHRRYDLGTSESEAERFFRDPDEFREFLEAESDSIIKLPVYMYDHSGITLRTSPFSCPWDSGQLGFIWITKAKAFEEFSRRGKPTKHRWTKKLEKRTLDALESTIKVMDQWVTGDVYGFVVEDEDGDHIDSCWGYFGFDGEDKKYILHEARSSADHELKRRAEMAVEEKLVAQMH